MQQNTIFCEWINPPFGKMDEMYNGKLKLILKLKEIERGKLEKFGKWRNHSVELARISFVDGSRKRILPQMTFVVPFSP